ncbi:ASCH domain-containing protein [Natrialbaceae archaeon GCM10025810]|uniref:ASCH domain-containing protein n=1 Tax=Halovalidus salilacus TaxID=3075124 RepID=UPI00361F35B2
MAEIDADELLPSERMRRQALEGEVTQIHRGQLYAEEGDAFEIDDATFEVVEVTERTLGDLTDEDARAEGMDDLESYRRLLERVHENFEWDDESEVVLHRFERASAARTD